MRQEPFVSVVVTARDEEQQIGACLASLLGASYPPDRREVILVDQGSADRTLELVRERWPGVRCVREPGRGVAAARNRGIEESRGEIVAFTDPDCSVATGWLAELAEGFADERVGAVAGAIVPYPPRTGVEAWAARRRSHSQERPLRHPRLGFAMTPNLAFRRRALIAAGRFDARFPGGGWEDADLCWRFRRRTDLELRYAPRAVVFHRYRSTARELLVQHYRYGYGLGLLRRKYPGRLPWGFRQRAGAWGGLATGAAAVGRAGLRSALGRGARRDLLFAYLDLVRTVGQRAGHLSATVPGRRL